MNRRLLLLPLSLLLLAAVIVSCDSSNPVAPPGTVLAMTANPTQISLGQSSTIVITGFRPDGNALFPGTQINLTTDLGIIQPATVEADDDGRATATLQTDGRPGTATVTASLPGSADSNGTVTVQIGEDGIRPLLTINTTPNRINIEQDAEISVIARNVDGSFLNNGRVRLRTTLGTLDQDTLTTDANGEARTMLRPDGRSGTATIAGSVDAGEEVSVDVTIIQTVVVLEPNPNIVPVLGDAELTVLVRDEDNVPLRAGRQVRLTANLGTIVPTTVVTNGDGEAFATYTAGDRAGTDELQAIVDNINASVTASITIRDAPAFIDLFSSERTIEDEGGTINLRAQVQNAQGEPLPGILVIFDSPDVGGVFQNTETVTTNTSGEATNVLTLTVNDFNALPPGQNTFRITATARGEGAEVTDQLIITVLGR